MRPACLFVVLLVALLPISAFAATSATQTGTILQGTDVAGTSHTISLNLDGTGANLTLFCVLHHDAGSFQYKTATWNGAATTTSTAAAGVQISGSQLIAFANPTTGTHNLVVTETTSKALAYFCFTFNNTKQTAQLDQAATNNNAAAGTSGSTAAATSGGNSFVIGWQLLNTTATNLANTDGTALGTSQTTVESYKLRPSWKGATGGADTLSYSWTTSVAWDNWRASFFDQAPVATTDDDEDLTLFN